jgi:PAS domain S-box-containing protein
MKIFSKEFLKASWIEIVILIAGLALTLLYSLFVMNDTEKQMQSEYYQFCQDIKEKIQVRLKEHELLLRSCSSLFAASDSVSRKEWKEYIENLNLQNLLPGIQGVGFSLIVPKNHLKNHIDLIRKEGFSNYSIKPDGEREIYSSIIYLEPFEDRNLRAFGYDMYSEPIRRKAMDFSRDNDIAMISGKVILVQETDKDLQAGTLMYVPVYKNNSPIKTIGDRRKAIQGWVYSPYRMYDLMNGILGTKDLNDNNRIHLQIYDGENHTEDNLLFDSQIKDSVFKSDAPERNLLFPIDFNGKKWTLLFSQASCQLPFLNNKVLIVIISGILINILMFFLMYSLVNTKSRAMKIADKVTAELKESEEKHRRLFETMQQGVVYYNNEGNIISVNPSAERILGINQKIAINKSYFNKDWKVLDLDRKILDVSEHPVSLVLKNGIKIENCILGIYNPHFDKNLWLSITAIPVFDSNNVLYQIYSTFEDITERMMIEEKLKESYIFLNEIIENSANALWISDEKGTMIRLNQSCRDVFQISDEEVIGKYNVLEDNILEDQGLIPLVNEVFEFGKKIRFVVKYNTKNLTGIELKNFKNLILDVYISPILDLNGKVKNAIIQHLDITDRIKTEQDLILTYDKLKHSKDAIEINLLQKNALIDELESIKVKLENTISEKDKFFSIIAHDLKSPFNGFLGLTELLANDITTFSLSEIQDFSRLMRDSASNLFSLLENLLEWSRMQRGNIEFSPEYIMVDFITKQNIDIHFPMANKKNINLVNLVPICSEAYADASMINGVLRNLLSNSIKFTPKGKTIEIGTYKNSDLINENELCFYIKDQGIGMSETILKDLFRVDHKISRKGTENEPSTGLGLLLCKEFIEKNKGRIWAESEVGVGSTFYFTLKKSI